MAKEKGIMLYGEVCAFAEELAGGDDMKCGEALWAVAMHAYRGEEYKGDDPIVKAVFLYAKPFYDKRNALALAGAKGGARSHGGGAPKGNQNARKHWDAEANNNKKDV